jgi:adenylate cyclase class 2
MQTLGFRPVATIRKHRETFHLSFRDHEIEIALDDAEGLGDFAEIETLAHGEDDLGAAQQAVMALASVLGLTEVEPRSYLRMILARDAGANQNHS